MLEKEMNQYRALNKIAEKNGIVVFGGTADKEIPLGELKQAFDLEDHLYNRSVTALSVNDAVEAYDACIAPLEPETVLLHIGDADLKLFEENSSCFSQKYRELIGHIRALNPKCRIGIVSLRNHDGNGVIAEMNKHLKYISESERCEYGDISVERVWNPQQTKDVISFVYSTGFVRPLTVKRPIYNLVKILFCYAPAHAV